MGLRTWTRVTGTVVQSTAGRYSSGYEWQVSNSDADRIANNRSLLVLRHWIRIDQASWQTSWGGFDITTTRNSNFVVNGVTRNIGTRYDLRQPNLTFYYVGTHTSVFPVGTTHSEYITHGTDGRISIPVSAFFNGNNTTNFTSASTSATLALPNIVRTFPAPASITFDTPTIGSNQACSWSAVANGGNYRLEYSLNGGAWTHETLTGGTVFTVPAARFAAGGTIQYRVRADAVTGWSDSPWTYSAVRTIDPGFGGIFLGTSEINSLYLGTTAIKEVIKDGVTVWKL